MTVRIKLTARRTERGVTTVEYAIAGGLISGAAIGVYALLVGNVETLIRAIATAIGNSAP